MKEKSYDYTSSQRSRRRMEKIKEAGLSEKKVLMHEDDAEEIKAYSKKLYEERGIEYKH